MTNIDIIKQIEKELKVKLKISDKIEVAYKGYTLNQNGQVPDLSLLECKIKNLNRIISPLKALTDLTTLDLSSNQLSDISPLKALTNLTTLNLNGNQLSDISPLKALTNLTTLNLNGNQLSDISPIKYLKKLKELQFDSNWIYDISPLKELSCLEVLHIGADNKVNNISPVKNLKNLKYLDLYKCEVSDISPIKNLKKLEKLNLKHNPIEKLPLWIVDLNMEIQWREFGTDDGYIAFYNNPLKNPPIEIVKQGKEAVRNYFEQLKKQGKDNIYEAKLMLVGEPGSGKTTLMNLLFDKNFPVPNKAQKSTIGIEVRQNWGFSINDKKDFKAHIWDFGGQQIQYMLHQFFLTPLCVYVLMAEKRRELANIDYWLNIINILGKNSPVIITFNEINIDSVASFIYDEKKYKDLFPELNLQRLDVNLGEIKDGRFDVLLNTIKQSLSNLEHIGKEVPARWVDIRKELEKRRAIKHIHIREYFDICKKFKIEREADQMLILGYFHLLGIVLHFCDDQNLCDTIFLDPNWTVDAVYAVLANKEIEKSNGFIKKTEIDKIWSEKGYDFEERAKLLQLMLKDKFDLCYKLPGTLNDYIVPLLLSPQKPEYHWDNKNNLQFRFQYPFMPKGIVSRLIVRMHEHIDHNKIWCEGVVFKKMVPWLRLSNSKQPGKD